MKKVFCLKFLFAGLMILQMFFSPKFALATFSISVTPYEGGSDLRFGKTNNMEPYANKELVVSISSDIAKQYQLIQTLLDPLSNDRGDSLSRENFSVYAIRGSNKYGTVSVEQETSVSPSRAIIYTSTPQGLADSFNLVYVLKPPFNVPSGSYRGRIAFTLEPIDSTQQSVTTILNIFAEIDIESSIEIKTTTGSRAINLSSAKPEFQASDVLVDIKGNTGSQFKISQIIDQPLESSQGQRLPYEAVNFKINGARNGTGAAQEVTLSPRQDVVYTSGSRGDADNFAITYSLAEPEKQRAGKYRTNLKYIMEGMATQKLLGNFSLEVEIARIFDLIITPEMGGSMQFGDLKLNQPAKQSEVTVEIRSNIGRQYQVNQHLISGLVNKEGRVIPLKSFTLREEGVGTKGTLRFTAPAEIKTGETTLFISDKNGSSDKFKVIYELAPSAEVKAGDYSGNISYSISEI